VFHHMSGNLSVNAKQLRLVQIAGTLMDEVKFGGGLLGHLDKGGSFSAHDSEIGPGIWDTAYLNVNMHGKVLFFHTIAVAEKEIRSEYRRVPDNLTLAQAAAILERGMSRHGNGRTDCLNVSSVVHRSQSTETTAYLLLGSAAAKFRN
jgi:hypothetical protein